MRNTLIAAAGLALAAVPATSQERIQINVVNGHPPVFLWVKHLTETFIPTVDAQLEGSGYAIDWREHYGGSLASVGGELEALEAGLAEVGVVPTVFEPSALPLQNVTYVTPFGTPDPVLVTEVVDMLHETVPGMAESWQEYGLSYLGGGFALDNYYLLTTFPVDGLADLEGRKIGAPGPAVNWLEGTGAVGVSGNLTTYYNDVQTGVFEGIVVFPTAAAPAKLHEVAPYVTKTDFGAQYAGSLVANQLWLDTMPAKVRDALRAGAAAYTEAFTAELVERVESSLATMEEGGATISELPERDREAWAAALPNVAQQWAEQAESQGLPGREVLSAYMEALRAADVDLARDWDKE